MFQLGIIIDLGNAALSYTDFITIFKTIWGAAVWCNMEENALYAPGKKREHRFCVLIMICVRGNRHY